jgi:hypothetical protein
MVRIIFWRCFVGKKKKSKKQKKVAAQKVIETPTTGEAA